MKKLLGVVVLVVAVGGAAAYYRANQVEVPPTPVTAVVSRGDVVQIVESTGSLQAVTTVDVGSQVSGIISELNADFNSVVRRGQLIARLEPSLFESQVDQARASLVRAEADLERSRSQLEDTEVKLDRAKSLISRDPPLIPTTDLETAEMNRRQAISSLRASEAQIVQARASLGQAEVNLSHTTIYAPIDGIVISRNVNVGQTVAASMSAPTLFLIARDLRDMQVQASIDESDIGKIQPGQTVRFRVDAYPNDEFRGTLAQVRLQPVVTQNVVSYTTMIDARNDDQRLKPGMTATLQIEVARADNVLRVPNAALRFRPTAETFAALGQEPVESGGRAGGQGRSGGQAAPDDGPSESTRGGGGGQFAGGQFSGRGTMTPEQRAEMRQRFENGGGRGRGGRGGGRGGNQGGGGQNGGGTAELWVLVDNRLEPRQVRTGIADTTNTAILEGLNEGDVVVTNVPTAQVAANGSNNNNNQVRNPLMPNVGRGGGGRGRGGFGF